MVGELAMMQMVNPWNMWMWFWMDALNVMVICFQKEAGRVVHDAMKRTNGVAPLKELSLVTIFVGIKLPKLTFMSRMVLKLSSPYFSNLCPILSLKGLVSVFVLLISS